MKALNTHDGWEDVINNPDRQERINQFHAKRKIYKLNRLSAKILICIMMAFVFGLFGITGAMVEWLSVPVALIFAGAGCFQCGRYCQLRGW